MATVLSPENRIFHDLTVLLHPFIIRMKYSESIKAVNMAFFNTSVYLKLNMKYSGSIESWKWYSFMILMNFNVSMKYGESIKSWKLQFSRTWRISTSFYHKYQV